MRTNSRAARGQALARIRRRAAAACAAFPALAVFIAAQLGILAGAWDVMPREPGYTYAIDPAIGAVGAGGARDAFSAWDAANAGVPFREAAWGEADIRVGSMEGTCAGGGPLVKGCACLGLWPGCPSVDNAVRLLKCPVPDGATIGVYPGVYAANGTLAPYTREQMRDLVAHEIGHNLGLHHNTADRSHLMHGTDGALPYSDRGYEVPDAVADDWTPAIPASEWGAPRACG